MKKLLICSLCLGLFGNASAQEQNSDWDEAPSYFQGPLEDEVRIEPELLTTKLILDFILLKCNSDILGQEDFEHVVKLSKEVDRKIEMLQKSFVAKNRKGLIVFI